MKKQVHTERSSKSIAARLLTFRVRTLILLVTFLAIFLFPEIRYQIRQRTAYQELKELKFTAILYDHHVRDDPSWQNRLPTFRTAIAGKVLEWFGSDLFNPIVRLSLSDVSAESVELIGDLRHLKSLHIGEPNKSELPSLEPLERCSQLEQLMIGIWFYPKNHPDEELRGNGQVLIPCHVSEKDIEVISKLQKLRVLAIGGPHVNDESIKPICKLPRLRNLYLCRSKVSEEGIEMLRASMPNVQISSMSNPDNDYMLEMESNFFTVSD